MVDRRRSGCEDNFHQVVSDEKGLYVVLYQCLTLTLNLTLDLGDVRHPLWLSV